MADIRSAAEAEMNAARAMRLMGYKDARVTGAGPDGGIDVVSGRAVAQVKWRKSGSTGRPEIQRLYGARGSAHSKDMLFFSASAYTTAAHQYANEHRVGLFVFNDDGSVRAVNGAGTSMAPNGTQLAKAGEFKRNDPRLRNTAERKISKEAQARIDALEAQQIRREDRRFMFRAIVVLVVIGVVGYGALNLAAFIVDLYR